jgi:hypothetical protein
MLGSGVSSFSQRRERARGRPGQSRTPRCLIGLCADARRLLGPDASRCNGGRARLTRRGTTARCRTDSPLPARYVCRARGRPHRPRFIARRRTAPVSRRIAVTGSWASRARSSRIPRLEQSSRSRRLGRLSHMPPVVQPDPRVIYLDRGGGFADRDLDGSVDSRTERAGRRSAPGRKLRAQYRVSSIDT